jgi:penicillin-binding protein 1A
VRPQAHARAPRSLRHGGDVALDDVEVDEDGRGLDRIEAQGNFNERASIGATRGDVKMKVMGLGFKLRGRRDWVVASLLALQAVAGVAGVWWLGRQMWAVHKLTRGVGDTIFFGADGKPWFPLDEQRRDVPLDQISPHVRHAVVAVEDHRFYAHPGIDPVGLARAMARNLRSGGVVEGGSTLTQQLARTLFLSNKRTWARKAQEAALAILLEEQLTKDQILELYLNRVYLSAGIYGVEAMSRKLFVKRARELNLAEAALVAGLIRAPSALSPWSNIDGAIHRSNVVLRRMREEGYITERDEQAAHGAKFRITASPGLANARSGYAKEFLRQQFRDRFGGDHPPDWQVHTSFVPAIQEAAERALYDGLRRLGVPGLQGALVALDPATGDILGLVGGRDFGASPFNRAVNSRRQPGSAFKPIVYAAALERGFSPVSVLINLHAVSAPGRDEWAPRNASADTPDAQTLREALYQSNNQAAVALQQKVGTGHVQHLAEQLGLPDQPGVPSLALGTGGVTPLELTAAFAVFPNGGWAVKPRAIVSVLDAQGSSAYESRPRAGRVLSEATAFQVLSMLRDVMDYGTGTPARSLGVGFPVGGKTGTTSDFKDAWFVGFSSAMVAGVWVGFDQPATITRDAYAARVALPIWADFMRRAARLARPQEFAVPAGLREVELCHETFFRPVEGCPTYVEYLKKGDDAPGRLCPVHRGSFKQEARRTIDGVLDDLGRKLRRIFKW